MSANSMPNINSLFQSAQDDGTLSAGAVQVLNVADIGVQIQAGLGIPVDDFTSSEVVLVTMMPDDSASIRFGSNAQAVRGGHNTVLDALQASKQKSNLLIHTRYLNGLVLYPYCPVDQAIRMNPQNYDPNLGTPLYQQTVVLLGTVLAKAQDFLDNGVPVRTVTLIITDGAGERSKTKPQDVAKIVNDMLKAENHVVAGMGIDDGHTDFRQVFKSMGIRDEWILTPGSTETEIRKAFQVFSQSAVRASQSSGQFSNLGGFGS